MWRYLILNSLWFFMLFSVHFYGSKKDQRILLAAVFLIAGFLAWKGLADPFAWAIYLVFSLLVFHGSAAFKSWVYARPFAVEEEVRFLEKSLNDEKKKLQAIEQQTGTLTRRAEEITGLYDRIRELSKCLNHFEAFLVFGEALASYFEFRSLKLAVFAEDATEESRPEEFYELHDKDFRGLFNRAAYLMEPKRAHADVFPFDEKVFAQAFGTRKPVRAVDPSGGESVAYPVLVHKKIFAVVTVTGVRDSRSPLLLILFERFLSELQRVKLYEAVESLATTDGLTGVYVRRHLMERMEGEWDRSLRSGFDLSLLMIDVDHFKNFNDTYGHLVGDAVLRETAQTVKRSLREVDIVGRYGGEEFVVMLVETGSAGAAVVAERIRRAVEEREIRAYDETLKVTVSIGCATQSGHPDLFALVEAADAALYQAKRRGRNQVYC